MFSSIHAIKSRVEDDPLTRVIPPRKAMSVGIDSFPMVGFKVRLWDSLVPSTPSNGELKKVQLLL